eukprot:2142450-Pyramimonas_sp.AAC.1
MRAYTPCRIPAWAWPGPVDTYIDRFALGLPLGSSTWVTFCEGVLQAVTAEITYLHEEPNVTATPAPTLPPGTACPCDQ